MLTPTELQTVFEHWHDYFLLAGTAAVTLLGLLFVALSLHVDLLVREDAAYLKAIALETFFSFIIVLFISMMFLLPDVSVRIRGTNMLVFGVLRAGRALLNLRHSGGERAGEYGRGLLLMRLWMPLLGGALVAISGVCLFRGYVADGMSAVVAGVFILLGGAAGASWDLLVKAAHIKHRRGL